MAGMIKAVIARARSMYHTYGLAGTLRRSINAPSFLRREREFIKSSAKLQTSEFDQKFGVETETRVHSSDLKVKSQNWIHAVSYMPTSPALFFDALSRIKVKYEDFIFIDCGSGKGRVLLMASEFPFKRIIGLEFSPELHNLATANISKYKSATQKCKWIESVCTDFTAYTFPTEPIIFYFFNPSEEPVMAILAQNIRKSFVENPRKFVAMYFYPRFGYLFEKEGFGKTFDWPEGYAIYERSPAKAASA